MRGRLSPAIAVAGLQAILAGSVFAQQPTQQPTEEHRQLGAHQHGAGKLDIAIEGRTVDMEFEVPASDIVGFEYEAKTTEQKQAVAQARSTLSKPLTLIKLPDAAGCKVASTEVKLVRGGDHDHEHDHAKADAPVNATATGKEAEAHSEFHAEYKFTCAKPELIGTIDLDYFKSFPRAQKLDVTIVGDKTQTKAEATRQKPRVELKPAG